MKLRFTWVLALGLGALGAGSCSEKKAGLHDLTVQSAEMAEAGKIISSAQAVAWTHRYQEAHPNDTWGGLFDAGIYKQLLGQDGCQGLRIYNAINEEEKNAFVLVGVDAAGSDLTSGKVADLSTPCPPMTYNSILVSAMPTQILPPSGPAGGIISLELATRMTHQYQERYPGTPQDFYYSAGFFHKLLEQEGCTGLRIYRAINDEDKECMVIVGVNAEGSDMTEGLLLDEGVCGPPHPGTSVLVQ
jgi:hypothetical protein